MAVTASALDNIPQDVKEGAGDSTDQMALDSHNENHSSNTPFNGSESHPSAEAVSQSKPDTPPQSEVNGDLNASDTSNPAAQLPLNSQMSGDELVGGDHSAPASGGPESTQKVPETQLPNGEDAMDISRDALQAPAESEDAAHSPTSGAPTKPMNELSLQTQSTSTFPSPLSLPQETSAVDQNMEDAPSSGRVRSREEDDDADVPDAKRTRTEESAAGEVNVNPSDASALPAETNGNGIAQIPQKADGDATTAAPAAGQSHVQTAVDAEAWPTEPMTHAQNKFLLERVRNTKKIKVAAAFKEPVDPVALNIPTYPTIVTNPMDLSTMENKLKEGKYPLVRDFMEDLDLVINNSILFNGKEHPVTQAGYNMRAYFLKGMSKMPRGDADGPPAKPPKAKKAAAAPAPKAKREPRTATAKSPTTGISPSAAWPLAPDGLPVIRRDSSSMNDRPKREIHKPAPKDLPYNNIKPKKKKYQQELRFCESVLTEIKNSKKYPFNFPFLAPVDPVALNIPTYFQVIKKPMDFGTIEKNLKSGQYQTAKDFYNDAQLVFKNCYTFNPEGDEVNKMGKQLHQLFDALWAEKSDWLAQHAPASEPPSPDYSDEDDEEDEEDPAQAQILAIQKQIQQLNETAQSLLQQQKNKRASPHVQAKKKSGKTAAPKKKGSLAVPPPPKPAKAKARSRPPAPLTFAQKQEISDGISTLGEADMRRAVQIIRNGCPHLANVNDDEMEIDMDEIGDDTLRELFKFIRQVRGPKGGHVDDDFEPPKVTHKPAVNKPKKNKPMGKKEQEESIRKLTEKLRHFEGSGSGSSQSPPANQDESSEDESSGSESEEE
ncbi:Bromodomain-containing protein [Westerdykella ornata]|uniref:Bromodomain-containing protein n=1 Tax=Westerdykella ornata TaxID=318751 RepID=A0A6A6J9P7_WESOR|nr:Bromodomain-containing protein [Westerdykella ornata]KAF2273310.1 Bromodomain-containing protein [Westerdykella ornata]